MDVKLGICNFCTPGVGVFAPRIVAEAGLDGMSVEYGTYEQGFPLTQPYLQQLYLEEQQKYGIDYPNVGCSGFDFIPFHARPGTKYYGIVRDALKNAVKAAANMGIPMVFVPGFNESEVKSQEDLEYAASMFQYFCDEAGEKGISVGYENQLSAKEQHTIFELVDRPNFGMFYDSNNFYFQKGWNQAEILDATYDIMLPQLHVKDGKKGSIASAILGSGDTDFYATIDVLKKKEYKGWLILENLYYLSPMRDLHEDWFELMRQDVAALKAAVR
ncbi:MAG: sugar phosphate isomerase/epimerase family protein [Christensenellales bacterium]|jgi:sugar phosphate isomerase/epimerase